MSSVNDKELASFVERIERLEEEKQAIQTDIKDVYGEAKSKGYDTKPLRIVIRNRKKSRAELEELEALTDLYQTAIDRGSK